MPPAPTPAPWRAHFVEHLSRMAQPSFVLSTVHADDGGSPRARTCIFRGMWAGLPRDGRNPAPGNPSGIYESDLPTFTTDARMAKAGDLLSAGSGGGGKVEAVWWAEKDLTQWRVRGRAWMLGRDIAEDARDAVRARMRILPGGGGEEAAWSWEREVTAQFGNLNPAMRGSFRNPPPGAERSETPPDGSGLGLGQTVDDVEDEVARANFRVCVIVPDEVDRLFLSGEDPRRWRYRYVGVGDGPGEWEVVELWP